jgi:hypothetical protein
VVNTLKKFVYIAFEDIILTPLSLCCPGTPGSMPHRGVSSLPHPAGKGLFHKPVLKNWFYNLAQGMMYHSIPERGRGYTPLFWLSYPKVPQGKGPVHIPDQPIYEVYEMLFPLIGKPQHFVPIPFAQGRGAVGVIHILKVNDLMP